MDKRKIIEWHPAFEASIQIEFENEIEKMTFEPEHLLSKQPMRIDELVIKIRGEEKIQKNIGRIFRKHRWGVQCQPMQIQRFRRTRILQKMDKEFLSMRMAG